VTAGADHIDWEKMVSDTVKQIKQARTASLGSSKGVGQGLTQREHDCFRDCFEIMKKWYDETDPDSYVEPRHGSDKPQLKRPLTKEAEPSKARRVRVKVE
jgi:hypothetical protein